MGKVRSFRKYYWQMVGVWPSQEAAEHQGSVRSGLLLPLLGYTRYYVGLLMDVERLDKVVR